MKCILYILAVLAASTCFRLEAPAASEHPLPLDVPAAQVRPLRELLDDGLQQRLVRRLERNPAWRKMILEKRMAVGLVDLSDPSNVLFARVNGNHMMYAASLPKIAILLAAFHCFEFGLVEQTPRLTHDLHLMIRKSDNRAATRVIERLGMERIQSILTQKPYRFYDKTRGGGLWVGKNTPPRENGFQSQLKGSAMPPRPPRSAGSTIFWPWAT